MPNDLPESDYVAPQSVVDAVWAYVPSKLGGAFQRGVVEMALVALHKAGFEMVARADVEFPAWGCHLEIDMTVTGLPDQCVIAEFRPEDCIYARGKTHPCQCEYWKRVSNSAAE